MAVSLEARDVAIFCVDQIPRLALLGSKEELPVAGCRLPLSPEGGHGQGGVGPHPPGERPLLGAAFRTPARDQPQFPQADIRRRSGEEQVVAYVESPGGYESF